MATKTVATVVAEANKILNDVTKARWSNQELLGWFNMASKAIIARRPDALVLDEVFDCTATVKQTLPANGLRLIKVRSNVLNGRAITIIEKDILDEQFREWYDESAPVDRVNHYVYDDMSPRQFYLYPCPVADHQIMIVYSISPVDIVIADDAFVDEVGSEDQQTLPLDDTYAGAYLDYILYRAYSKDASYAANDSRSNGHFSGFLKALGDKTAADQVSSPKSEI